MLKNLKSTVVNQFIMLKKLFRDNKWIGLGLLIAFAAGFFSALNGVKGAAADSAGGNIIIFISGGNFNYFLNLLKLVGFILLMYLLLLITPHNFYLFFVGFISAIIYVRIVLRGVFISCIIDGFSAYILLFVFWLPVIAISLLCYFCAMCKIYAVCGYTLGRRRAICVPTFRHMLSIISKPLAANLLSTGIFYTLFVLILICIY